MTEDKEKVIWELICWFYHTYGVEEDVLASFLDSVSAGSHRFCSSHVNARLKENAKKLGVSQEELINLIKQQAQVNVEKKAVRNLASLVIKRLTPKGKSKPPDISAVVHAVSQLNQELMRTAFEMAGKIA